MITFEEYQNALNIINKFKEQTIKNVEDIRNGGIKEPLPRGTKIKFTSVGGTRTKIFKVGDIVEVFSSYIDNYDGSLNIRVKSPNTSHISHITKGRGRWDFDVLS